MIFVIEMKYCLSNNNLFLSGIVFIVIVSFFHSDLRKTLQKLKKQSIEKLGIYIRKPNYYINENHDSQTNQTYNPVLLPFYY